MYVHYIVKIKRPLGQIIQMTKHAENIHNYTWHLRIVWEFRPIPVKHFRGKAMTRYMWTLYCPNKQQRVITLRRIIPANTDFSLYLSNSRLQKYCVYRLTDRLSPVSPNMNSLFGSIDISRYILHDKQTNTFLLESVY